VPDLPEPEPDAISWLSPSLANDLLDCAYRVAWRMDAAYRMFRRPSTYTELGTVAHALLEDAGKGAFMRFEDEKLRRAAVEQAWSEHVGRAHLELASAWSPISTPSPEEWPGYHLTKARIIRRAMHRRSVDIPGEGGGSAPLIEVELRDEVAGLRGRPDRVEGPTEARRVIDLKSGLGQADPTLAQLRQLMLYGHLVETSTGNRVSEIAIEDASGHRWAEPFDHVVVDVLLSEIEDARSTFESARAAGSLADLATPSADDCRWCPFRLLCAPYWESLESSWQHGSVLGTIDRTKSGAKGSIVEMTTDSPTDASGTSWIVSMAPAEYAIVGTKLAVAGAEITGAERHLRWRWTTVARLIT
jgi:hypothetical protein